MANIPNKSDGDNLLAANLFKIAEFDKTPGSVNNSTTETQVAEVILSADQVSEGVIINAWGKLSTGTGNTATINIYSGTSSSFGSNTSRITLTKAVSSSGNDFWNVSEVLTTEETWSGQVYVQVTAQNSVANPSTASSCERLITFGV